MGRLRDGELIAGAGAAALPGAMFLKWYEVDGGVALSAWQAFGVLDIVLAALMLVPFALVLLQATRRSPSLPVAFSVLTALVGKLAALLILYRILNQPGDNGSIEVQLAAWLGVLAAVVTAIGGWRSMRDEAMPGIPAAPVTLQPAP